MPLPTRVIGEFDSPRPGPTVVVTGSIHGNEPAGSRAIANVFAALERRGVPVAGRLVGLRGNLRALSRGRRFVDRDLNRRWHPEHLATIAARPPEQLEAEDAEQRELLAHFVPELERATEPVVFIDLHSASGEGPPFSCMADVIRNRPIAFSLPIPVVLGLEEVIEGSMLGYLVNLGHVGVAVEGGQHDHPQTVLNHEAVLWLALVAAGAIDARDAPDLEEHRSRLIEATRGLPSVMEIRHRHIVQNGDEFEMLPGFVNFDRLRAGQAVARDQHGVIRAPERGVMLLPRYQGQGEDGYFVARAIDPFWLQLSAGLRRLGADRAVPFVPGVRPHPREPDTYVVQPTFGPNLAKHLFHLFGYRRVRPQGNRLEFSRRKPDAGALAPLPEELRAWAHRDD